jgi:hypothetical protein
MSPLPTTAGRVPAHTAPQINRRIAFETHARLERIGQRPEAIRRRLEELEREWDIERAIEANAATLMLAGTALGAWYDRRFLALPLVVSAFLLQHAVQGWCPPVPALRRLGFRTAREIEDERNELLRRQDHLAVDREPASSGFRHGGRSFTSSDTTSPEDLP